MPLTSATVFIGRATWVLAVGSLVAAAFAILAYFMQRREVGAIRRQLKDQEDVQRRSQAVKVTAWLDRSGNDAWVAHIRNASDQPIFDVRTFFYEICKKPGEGWKPIPRGGPPPRDETICVFPPNSSRGVAVPDKIRALFQDLTERTCVVSIEFTDAAENRWKRDPHGALVPLTDITVRKLGHPLAGLPTL